MYRLTTLIRFWLGLWFIIKGLHVHRQFHLRLCHAFFLIGLDFSIDLQHWCDDTAFALLASCSHSLHNLFVLCIAKVIEVPRGLLFD